MKKSYVALSSDLLHPGHLRVVRKAAELGELTVGLMTDAAIAMYKEIPKLTYHHREEIVSSIQGVKNIIPQNSLDYTENLIQIKPDYVVHGDDWREGIQKKTREKVLELLKQWGGELIEVPYAVDFHPSKVSDALLNVVSTQDFRRSKLRRLLAAKNLIRGLEAHNGLTALIVEKTHIYSEHAPPKEFDFMWSSSLTDSTSKGMPDIEAVDVSTRALTLNEILAVSNKPIIYDADTGGKIEHFVFTVRTLERLGVSAVIIEDKIGLKKNSLFGTDVPQSQDTIEGFCAKLKAAKAAQITDDFMVIARIESLILDAGMDDAVARATAYIDAGADGILIHSRQKDPAEIFQFCETYSDFKKRVPLIVVPSSFNDVTEDELEKRGVNVVIYANHLLRAAYPAMLKTAKSILTHGRSAEADSELLPIKEILELIPGTK